MKCPKCGVSMVIIDTRKNDYYVLRKRKCSRCGKCFTTEEWIVTGGSKTAMARGAEKQ